MKIGITGGAGFIGTNLTRWLLRQGHQVSILDNFLPQIHGDRQALPDDLKPHVRLEIGDISDPAPVGRLLRDAEAIVHLAAETGTGQSMYEASRYSRTNVEGTARIFDWITAHPSHQIRRIVVASSRALYGEGAYRCENHGLVYPDSQPSAAKAAGQFDPACPLCGASCASIATPEEAPLKPTSFYGLTKLMQENMVLLFGEILNIPSIALRYQNVYGPGQSLQNPYTGILAIFSGLARAGNPIRVFEDGFESRDFVFIKDVVTATSAALTTDQAGCHAINVGSGERTAVLEVAEQVNMYFGNKSSVEVNGAFRQGDIRHGFADLGRALRLLQYQPRWRFCEGLREFLAWAEQSSGSTVGYERSLAEMRDRGLLRDSGTQGHDG